MYNDDSPKSQFKLMALALLIAAGVGLLIFVLSYLAYVFTGFKHHFVTGIISALPVLNIVTVPSQWHKSRGKVILSFIGLLIAVGSWLLGADKAYQNLLRKQTIFNSGVLVEKPVAKPESENTEAIAPAGSLITASKANLSSKYDESDLQSLPEKALYRMSFETVPVNKISTLQDRIIQIITTNNERIEGRVLKVAPGSVIIGGILESEIPIANIKTLKLMIKKAR